MIRELQVLYHFFRIDGNLNYKIIIPLFIIVPFASLSEILSIAAIGVSIGWLLSGSVDSDNIQKVLGSLDVGIENQDILVIGILLLIVLNVIIQTLSSYVINRLTGVAGSVISHKLFNSYMESGGERIRRDDVDHKYHMILVEAQRVTLGIVNPILTGISKLSLLVFILIGFFILDPMSAAVGFLAICVLYLVVFFLLRSILKVNGALMSSIQSLRSAQITRIFGNIKAFKVYGDCNSEQGLFKKNSQSYFSALVKINFITSTPRFFIEFLLFFAIGFVLYLDITSIINITADMLANFAIYIVAMIKIIPAAQTLYACVGSIQGNSSALSAFLFEYHNYYDITGFSKNKVDDSEVKSISFSKDLRLDLHRLTPGQGKQPILHSLDITLKKGESYGFVGPSGLCNNSEGCLYIDGVKLAPDESGKIRKLISYVDQSNSIFAGTVAENISYGFAGNSPIDTKRMSYALEAAFLTDVVSSLKDGIETQLSDTGKELSGGERQRIALARALYKRSDILILDEVTSALDDFSENQIIKSLHKIRKDVTILLVSHREKPLRVVNNIIQIQNGTIINTVLTDRR